MKRLIDYFLLEWKNREGRKPLLLRGARQVGKTYAVRKLGKSFSNFIEINLESNEAAKRILEQDIDIDRIILQLSELLGKSIKPGTTLLFIDEAQIVPKAITALRYFYETIPGLHVIAAGSLVDFAIEEVGIPVGRVSTLYLYPLSFFEFLVALGHKEWARTILTTDLFNMSKPLHDKLINLVGIYLAIGGMPEAIMGWIKNKESRVVKMIHADLLYAYEQDFGKYARQHQVKYLGLIFSKAIEQLSTKFMYSRVGEYQKRELAPALELLEKAGIIYKVLRTAGQGIPLGGQADLNKFKIIFLDVGLTQALLKLDISSWFIDPVKKFINQGELVEAFVGQELLAYSDPIRKDTLFYWSRENRNSSAEVDYLIQQQSMVIPIEVKAGENRRIKSMQIFLESHPNSHYGIRIWAGQASRLETLHSYPLCAVMRPLIENNEDVYRACLSILL